MSKRWTIEDIERLQAGGNVNVPELVKNIPQSEKPKPTPNPTSKERHQALGRLKTGQMNKTEERYAAHLDTLKLAGEVAEWWFEPMNLRLADKCFYQIDFLVQMTSGVLEVHEVKGRYMTDDSLVKIKVAAEKFPFVFRMMIYDKKQWTERNFSE